ncbi:hypothetical protein B5M09_006934 [Aphanomyces astaci]|uniref:Cilia- and flagella-associated protein 36 n=1 Tax=Aphanomyces astaci TaxID=112090 RepID=A0A3R7Y0T1_APHAT|nr:hypothetical protein B5M09_006934 [Aphanomyces astaci]
MLTHGCALGQALADVLAEMEAEGESLTLGEKEATMQVMEDILFSHMQDASDFSETAPSRRGTNTSGSRRRVATDVGLHVVANVEEYSSYMETWRMHMTDTTIKVEGDVEKDVRAMDIGHIQDEMIRELMLYIAGADFQSTFEAFFLKHALRFSDDDEHKLEYTDLFMQFQDLFEDFMKQFYDKHSITEAEFGKRCRSAVKNDQKASEYLEVVLASMDYQAFFNLMKFMRRRAKAEPKPAAKRKISSSSTKESEGDEKRVDEVDEEATGDEGKAFFQDDDDDESAKESKRK